MTPRHGIGRVKPLQKVLGDQRRDKLGLIAREAVGPALDHSRRGAREQSGEIRPHRSHPAARAPVRCSPERAHGQPPCAQAAPQDHRAGHDPRTAPRGRVGRTRNAEASADFSEHGGATASVCECEPALFVTQLRRPHVHRSAGGRRTNIEISAAHTAIQNARSAHRSPPSSTEASRIPRWPCPPPPRP
jgi:hypothetical protein